MSWKFDLNVLLLWNLEGIGRKFFFLKNYFLEILIFVKYFVLEIELRYRKFLE